MCLQYAPRHIQREHRRSFEVRPFGSVDGMRTSQRGGLPVPVQLSIPFFLSSSLSSRERRGRSWFGFWLESFCFCFVLLCWSGGFLVLLWRVFVCFVCESWWAWNMGVYRAKAGIWP